MVPPTRQRLVKWVSLAAAGLVTFAVGAQRTFPYARLKDRLVAALSAEFDVRVDRVSPGWLPGRFRAEGVELRSRGEAPFRAAFDRIDVDVEILDLVFDGRVEMEIDASGPSGEVEGTIEETATGVVLDLAAHGVPLAFLTGAAVAGEPELRIRLTLPDGRLSAASGAIELGCDDCATLPAAPVRLGRFDGRAGVQRGLVCLASPLPARSADGELALEGGLRLADDIGESRAELTARHADGRAAFAASGRLGQLRWLPAPQAVARAGERRDCSGIAAPGSPAAPGSALDAPVAAAPPALPVVAAAPVAPAGQSPPPAPAAPVGLDAGAVPVAPPVAPPPLEPEIAPAPPPPSTPPEATPRELPLEF